MDGGSSVLLKRLHSVFWHDFRLPSLEYEHQLDEVVAGLCLVMLQAYSGMVCQVGGEGVGVQKWFLRD